MSRRAALPLLLLVLLAPTALPAQGWTVDLSAGHAVERAASELDSDNLMLGLRRAGALWAYLQGGVPVSGASPAWGALGGGTRLGEGVGADLAVHGFGYGAWEESPAGGGATLEALPLLSRRGGGIGAEVRSGVVLYARSSSMETVRRAAWQSDAHLSAEPDAGVTLSLEGRVLRVAEGGFPYVGAAAEIARERGSVWAFAGRWLADSLPVLHGEPRTGAVGRAGAGASLRLPSAMELAVSWQSEGGDPVYGSLPRRSWSVRLSRALGGGSVTRVAGGALPLPPVVTGGEVEIRIRAREAGGAPSLLGDFSEWEPVAMVREGEFWVARLRVPPGTYHYGFRTAGGEWFLPESHPMRVDDGLGGVSAVLVVPGV